MNPVDGRAALCSSGHRLSPACRYRIPMAVKRRGGRAGKAGATGPRGPQGARGAAGRRGDIGKPGPKGLKSLGGALQTDLWEMVVTHFEDLYRQLTALQKRIEQIQHRLPPPD